MSWRSCMSRIKYGQFLWSYTIIRVLAKLGYGLLMCVVLLLLPLVALIDKAMEDWKWLSSKDWD